MKKCIHENHVRRKVANRKRGLKRIAREKASKRKVAEMRAVDRKAIIAQRLSAFNRVGETNAKIT